MKMEWVRTTGQSTWQDDLNNFVPLHSENTSVWKQIMRIHRTTHDLEQHRNSGRDENLIIDAEPEAGEIESKREVERDIGNVAVGGRFSRNDRFY